MPTFLAHQTLQTPEKPVTDPDAIPILILRDVPFSPRAFKSIVPQSSELPV